MTAAPARDAGGGLRSCEIVDGSLRLVLNNTLDAIEAGRLEIARRLAPLALDRRVLNRLEVVFEELISNIVRHGFQAGSEETIVVMVATRAGAVELTIEDDGPAYDPAAAPAPEPFGALAEAKLGGLGVALARRLCAEFRYEPVAPDAQRRELGDRVFAPRNRVVAAIATTP
jgi:anti-sigma regulatory factor (Ser/Thr protein kinase)